MSEELEELEDETLEELLEDSWLEELLELELPEEDELEPPPPAPPLPLPLVATLVESDAVQGGELLSVTVTDTVPQPVMSDEPEEDDPLPGFCQVALLLRM